MSARTSWNKGLPATNRGQSPSEETRRKLSASLKGIFAGTRNPFFGRKHSPETLERLSKRFSGERNPSFGKRRTMSPEARAKISAAQLGKPLNPLRRARQSRTAKISEQAIAQRDTVHQLHASKIELLLGERLRAAGVKGFSHQTRIPGATKLGFFHPFDHLNVETKTAIEVNGCYWHACPRCVHKALSPHQLAKHKRDAEIKDWAQRLGYRLIVVWECGLRAPRRVYPGIDLVGEVIYGGNRRRSS